MAPMRLDRRAGLLLLGSSALPVLDNFTRADATQPGRTETGQVWAGSTYGIASGRLYNTASNFVACLLAGMPTDQYTVQVTLAVVDNTAEQHIQFRRINGSNSFRVGHFQGSWQMIRTLAGAETSIASAVGTPANGEVWKLTVGGDVLSFYLNGALLMSATDTNNRSGSGIGLSAFSGTTARFDTFSIRRGLQ
jgi:hypothetical protein